MRMLWGGVSLLLTSVIVALVAKTQLRQVGSARPASSAASAVQGGEPGLAATPARDLPRKVQDDLVRALQAAPERSDESR